MGIRDLSKLIDRFAQRAITTVYAKDLRGVRWAVDANIFIYRFMTAKPHVDGRHIERYRRFVRWIQSFGVVPIFVFDGESPEEKTRELKTRREQKKKATTHLRDLQQGVSALQHLDWRWWQLVVVLRAVALINSPRLLPIVPMRLSKTLLKSDEEHSSAASRELPAPEEPNVALGALFQLLAETLEWGTEAFLPNRLVQNLVDQSFLVKELPREQLPPLVRFVAHTRLRRHTPHMVEIDWMRDPSDAATASPDGDAHARCDRFGGQKMITSQSVPLFEDLKLSCSSTAGVNLCSSAEDGIHVKLPPIVLIGGEERDEDEENKTADEEVKNELPEKKGNCATVFACKNTACETLEALLNESLNRRTKSQDIFRPFLVCIHCSRDVAHILQPIANRYRSRLDAAWQDPSQYTFLILAVVHETRESQGAWLLPSAQVAVKSIPLWQESIPWPNKNQEKMAKGANFDYYNWICSARSSAWWFDMRDEALAAAEKKEENESSSALSGEKDGEESLYSDSAMLKTLPERIPCIFESELYTCAAKTLTRDSPDQNLTKKNSRNKSTTTHYNPALLCDETSDELQLSGAKEEEELDEQPTREKGVRPTKHRLECLETPEQQTMLLQQMETQIATLEPQVTRVTGEQLEEVKQTLKSMNVVVLTAEHEAEATCARLCRAGLADWVVSEDFDAMPFGAQKMLRHLDWTVAVLGEDEPPYAVDPMFAVGDLIDFQETLALLRFSAREFVDLCILCGCDFCTGLQDCNYTLARDLVLRYGSLENIIKKLDPRGRFAKGLRLFNLENAVKARKLFLDNHTEVLPSRVVEQLRATSSNLI